MTVDSAGRAVSVVGDHGAVTERLLVSVRDLRGKSFCSGKLRLSYIPPHRNENEVADVPVSESVQLGANVQIRHPDQVNLYGCTIGADTIAPKDCP